MDIDAKLLQWIYVTLVAPVLGWLGGWLHAWKKGSRSKKARIKFLSGIPLDAKAALLDFHFSNTHTLRGDPGSPVAKLLISYGILHIGPGGGSYDAVDRFLTIKQPYWDVLESWVKKDASLLPLLTEKLEEPNGENSQS